MHKFVGCVTKGSSYAAYIYLRVALITLCMGTGATRINRSAALQCIVC